MIDQFSKTGVEGYKIEAVYADAQSKPDVAINEAVRLIEQWGRMTEAEPSLVSRVGGHLPGAPPHRRSLHER